MFWDGQDQRGNNSGMILLNLRHPGTVISGDYISKFYKEVKMRLPDELKKDYFCYSSFWAYLFKAWCENYDFKKKDFNDEFEKFATYTARDMVKKWLAKKIRKGGKSE